MSLMKQDEIDIGIKQLPGVGPVGQKKLENAGIKTVYDLLIRGSMEVNELTGMGQDKASEAMTEAWNVLGKLPDGRKKKMTLFELDEHISKLDRILLHEPLIDDFFKGGLKTEALYEIYGEFGSGKTQFSMTAMVETLEAYPDTTVVYIDCEKTMNTSRMLEIARERGFIQSDEEGREKYFPRIEYFDPPNTDEIVNIVDNLSTICIDKNPKLIILDGAIGQFRSEYLGRGTLSVRQNNLARFMGILTNLTYFFSCCIILTNQVQADPGMMFGDPIKPIGGNVVGHASTYRIYFKKAGGKRVMRMVDSPEHGMNDLPFDNGVAGIKDAKKT